MVYFSRALHLLKEVEDLDLTKLSLLEKEGIIQRFEYTLELAWKVLKDKMESDGHILESYSPKKVIKEAFKNKYIEDVDTWLDMINDRNQLSHVYSFEIFNDVIQQIQTKYLTVLNQLFLKLSHS